MSGVIITRHVLVNDTTVVTLVPSARIVGGVLPQGAALPAISIESINRLERHVLGNSDQVHVTESVQVTVLAKSYDEQLAVQNVIRAAIRANRFPAVAGLLKVTVHTGPAGPDFMNEEASIYMGTQDVRTTFSEPR